mgnify:FL=1
MVDFNPKTAAEGLLAELPKRTAQVLEKRFGLVKSGKRFTLEAIGQTYGITRERVRQIERDGVNRIKKSSAYANLQQVFSLFQQEIAGQGGITAEDALIVRFNTDGTSGTAARFLFSLAPHLIFRGESDSLHARWGENADLMDTVEEALASTAQALADKNEIVSYEQLAALMEEKLRNSNILTAEPAILRGYIAASKAIGENYFNQWGLVSSPLIRPRGIRDLAYLAFQKEAAPMHFSQAAHRISVIAHPRKVHPQTVHNELIKDPRFVLVGRGTYGLVEWGFEPGTVRDIITRVLANNRMHSKEDIVRAVKERRQVKENTILINLQNRKYFKKFPDGTYGNMITS